MSCRLFVVKLAVVIVNHLIPTPFHYIVYYISDDFRQAIYCIPQMHLLFFALQHYHLLLSSSLSPSPSPSHLTTRGLIEGYVTLVIDTLNLLSWLGMNPIVIEGALDSWVSIEILMGDNLECR